jgi:hypothetical protein
MRSSRQQAQRRFTNTFRNRWRRLLPKEMRMKTILCLAIAMWMHPTVANAGEISPWRQTMCQQSGSGDQLTLVISFSPLSDSRQASSAAPTRVLNFGLNALSAITELGRTIVAWQNMGHVRVTLASAIHPDFKQPGFVLQLDLPPEVVPPGEFGVIDADCRSKLSAITLAMMHRMDQGVR